MYLYAAIQTDFEMPESDDDKEDEHASDSQNPFYTILYHSHFELWKNKPVAQL